MTVFSYCTRSTDQYFTAHRDRREAVEYLLDAVGEAATGPNPIFWASDDGTELMQADKRCPDYQALVLPTLDAAWQLCRNQDPESLVFHLRDLANSVLDALEARIVEREQNR